MSNHAVLRAGVFSVQLGCGADTAPNDVDQVPYLLFGKRGAEVRTECPSQERLGQDLPDVNRGESILPVPA
jgi:hypothetical protein